MNFCLHPFTTGFPLELLALSPCYKVVELLYSVVSHRLAQPPAAYSAYCYHPQWPNTWRFSVFPDVILSVWMTWSLRRVFALEWEKNCSFGIRPTLAPFPHLLLIRSECWSVRMQECWSDYPAQPSGWNTAGNLRDGINWLSRESERRPFHSYCTERPNVQRQPEWFPHVKKIL